MRISRFVLFSLFVATAGGPSLALAQSPALVPIQGQLFDAGGEPINTATTLTVSLYATPTGGQAVYTESQSITPGEGGEFVVFAGQMSPLDLSLFANESEVWVGLTVAGDNEMTPRFRLGTAPYAAYATRAGEAMTLEGASAGDFALSEHTHAFSELTAIPDGLSDGDDVLSQSTVEGYARGVCYDTEAELTAALPGWDTNASDDLTTATQFRGDVTGSAGATQIAADSVTSSKIIAGGVESSDLADDAVTNAKLADNAVSGAKILNGTVTSVDLANGAVGTAQLASNAVTASQIAENAVGASEIVTNGVGALEIATNAVGSSEIATNAVGAAEISANAVGTSEINMAAVFEPPVTSAPRSLVDLTSTTFSTLTSQSIDIPGPGTVVVMANWEHRVLSGTFNTGSVYLIADSPTATSGSLTRTFWTPADSGIQYIGGSHFTTFRRSSAGRVTAYFRGRMENSSTTVRAYNIRLLLFFIPS